MGWAKTEMKDLTVIQDFLWLLCASQDILIFVWHGLTMCVVLYLSRNVLRQRAEILAGVLLFLPVCHWQCFGVSFQNAKKMLCLHGLVTVLKVNSIPLKSLFSFVFQMMGSLIN